MSLMRVKSSTPDDLMVAAYSTCLGVRFCSLLSCRWLERIIRLLSGVRSSWDMFARNSDL